LQAGGGVGHREELFLICHCEGSNKERIVAFVC